MRPISSMTLAWLPILACACLALPAVLPYVSVLGHWSIYLITSGGLPGLCLLVLSLGICATISYSLHCLL